MRNAKLQSLWVLAALAVGCEGLTSGEDDGGEPARQGREDAGFTDDAAPPGGDEDAAPDLDAEPGADGAAPGDPDGALPGEDAGPADPDAGPEDPDPDPEGPCGEAIDANGPRVVLVGHPHGVQAGQEGHDIRSLTLTPEGQLLDDGIRLDVGGRPAQITFVPSGRYALVLTKDSPRVSTLTSIEVNAADDLVVIDSVALPVGAESDLQLHPDGTLAHVIYTDGSEQRTGGIYTASVACDGTLDVHDGFYEIPLAEALAFVPGSADKAVVLGGQKLFEPIVHEDIRTLEWRGDTWVETGAFDVWRDFVDAAGIALSGDGRTLLVPNGSPFSEEGHQIAVVSLDQGRVTGDRRIRNMEDARRAVFAPDGVTGLVTRFEPGRITVLLDQGNGHEVVDEVTGLGLAEDMAIVARGSQSGLVLVPGVHPADGSLINVLDVQAPGMVVKAGRLKLGDGLDQIPGAIGVAR